MTLACDTTTHYTTTKGNTTTTLPHRAHAHANPLKSLHYFPSPTPPPVIPPRFKPGVVLVNLARGDEGGCASTLREHRMLLTKLFESNKAN